MSGLLSEEQKSLVTSVRRLLAEENSPERMRAVMRSESGYVERLWNKMATELGLQGLALPVEYGGSGTLLFEQVLVLEEMGRSLFGSPYLATAVMGCAVLEASGDDTALKDLLPRVAQGSLRLAVGLTGDDDTAPGTIAVSAVATADGYALSGLTSFVVEGLAADLLLVFAESPEGMSLFSVDPSLAGVTRTALETLDLTRRQARVNFDAAAATLIGVPGDGPEILARATDVSLIALAAEELGGAQRCLDVSVEYAKIRQQFARPIGSFQAIKHACSDMLVAVESARSAVYHAAAAAAVGGPDLTLAAPMAKVLASEAFTLCARQNIQIHGGIGCTWEHDAHLFYRRAESSALALGDNAHLRRLLAQRLGISPATT